MEPMAHSPSPTWSLDGGPLPLPLLTPVLDPDDSTLTDSTLQTDFHIVGLAQQGVMDEIDESPSRMGPGGSTQRSPRPSAFTSLQAWDSDSEKEMLDEEELQHFSNPHGLAAHSPGPSLGSPTAGLLQESPEFDIDKSPKRIQHLDLERDFPSSCNEWDQGNIIRAQTDEPKTKRRTSAGSQSKKGTLKKSTGSLLSKAKPNQRRRKSVGIKEKPKGKEEVPLLDVYSFPGDSDAESSPPAHWAQCTYTQRRRKKRALLKPFSSQASQRSKPAGTKQPVVKARKGAGPKKASGAVAFRGQKKGDDAERMEQKVAAGSREKALCQEIFTCVECSIYFKKQVHLREHVQQHCQSCDQKTDKAKVRDGEMFACLECGWELEDGVSLSEHHRLHQESRDKILKEIRKLDKNTMEGDIDGSVKVRTKRRAQRRTPQQRPSSSQGVRTPKCDTCGFEASSQSALREHSCQISPSLTTELEGESFPGTSRDFCSHDQDSPSKSKLKTTAGMTTQDVPALPSAVPTSVQAEKSSGKAHRRDVAYKSIGNHRTWAREEGGRGPTSHLQLSKMESTENQDHVVDETEEEKASLHSDSSRITSWLKDESSPSMEAKFIHAGQEKLDDGDEEEVNDCDDDEIDEDADRFLTDEMLDDEPGSLRNVEKKCPYCPEQFHNGIGLANHVRGHLNRVGVSYNVRHFISPEEVNAIERKFSYQKKRKKANFDPDTFSLMRCEFCSAGFDTRAGLSSHARAHLRDFGITNWEVTVSPINVLRELFSSRPDLVPPTGPPLSSPGDEDFDLDEEAEEPDEAGGTGGGGALEGTGLSSSSSPPSHPVFEAALEEAEEFDEPTMEEATPSTKEDARLSKDSESMSAPPPRDEHDTKATPLLKCEVCFAPFETRRGLSSHARSHLRQLGISISESSGAPIDLLYQLIREREDSFSPTLTPSQTSSTKKTMASTSVGRKHVGTKQAASEVKHEPLSPPLGPSSSRSSSPLLVKSRSASPLLKKAPVSSLLPASSPLRYLDSRPSLGKSASASVASPSSGKPFWAPQETDAPLNLMETDSNDIVCQLCGAWFETRKGLSSHARAHLRHFGVVDAENKGSPIDYLYQLIRTDDFKHRIGTLLPEFPEERGLPSPSTKRLLSSSSVSGMHKARPAPKASASSLLLSPPVKRLKASERSILPVFRLSGGELTPLKHGEALKEIACEFCGEYFENRKGLSSHARSHLRQLGITEWSVNGSPIDTLRELIIRQGLPCALPVQMMKTPPPSPSLPLSPSASPSSSALGKRLPFSAHQLTAHKMGTTSIVSLPVKPEPVQVEVSSAEVAGEHEIIPVLESWSSHGNILPLNQVPSAAAEPTREIGCEFCGEYFENRKGLSSHARSHLRQLGITQWSVNGSPIDTLREVMRRRGVNMSLKVKKEPRPAGGSPVWDELGCTQPKYSRKAHLNRLHSGSRLLKQGISKVLNGKGSGFWGNPALGKRLHQEETYLTEKASSKMFSNQPVDYSFKGKSPPDKYSASHSAADASCELCGFYFENRKALASHARAHLRQFGVTEWCVNGSPIETLSAWIRSKPHKVAEMHRRYLQGVRHFPKKQKNSSSFSLSADSRGALYPGSHKPLTSQRPSLGMPLSRRVGREVPGAVWGASRGRMPQDMSHQVLYHGQVARSELNVRTPRGYERRPPKHLPHSEGGDRDAGPPKPPRTGTIPALVPKPPSTPLVKLVGKIYSLQCRFCERTFHGPLSVQEDWIRHLQQHILNLNYSKPDPASADPPPTSPPPTAESQTEVKEALPPPEEESLPPPTLNAVPDPLTPTALTPDALTPDLPPEQVSAQDV